MIKIFLVAIIVILAITNFNNYNQVKNLEEQVKSQNEIIEIDNQLIEKHERELELYGDFIVAILDGEDRERILMKESVLKAGANMTEIRKEINILLNKRKL